ncbi:hypothetical protein [Photobacterium sanguinicancri]|uniref:hypothetical protein n=1 Tax=Photobacterium sanguinicancri TaxID=875932 RepID=UPI0026E3ABF6|nr:hypothetical protein [Photobacterium sanguinicancri]MDO6497818.1 hypothetical protein [Photobacterium sanguinicancri]
MRHWHFKAIGLSILMMLSSTLSASTIYIGDDATYGQNLPFGTGSSNDRADSIRSLTYIYSDNSYTASKDESIKIDEVNLVSHFGGNLTPFVAKYDGGALIAGSSYELITTGDTLAVAANSLLNLAFTVSGINPIINLLAGETIVAGLYQDERIVMIDLSSPTPDPTGDWIHTGNVIPATSGQSFSAAGNAEYFFRNTHYRYNIGLSAVDVPEPTALAMMTFGLVMLMLFGSGSLGAMTRIRK